MKNLSQDRRTKKKNLEKVILEAEHKLAVIKHLNDEHQNELLEFSQVLLKKQGVNTAISSAIIQEIYHQGIELSVELIDKEQAVDGVVSSISLAQELLFIDFLTPIHDISELQNQYILLMQKFSAIQGKKSIKIAQQRFEFINSYKLSKNMLRLLLQAEDQQALEFENSAGYAYLFDLIYGLSDEQASKTTREHCYYTLRKVFTSKVEQDAANNSVRVWIDVYLHGDAAGGNWAKGLSSGDVVVTKREFPEKVSHLTEGQVVLIADETSLPTVARILELWSNSLAPVVICITNEVDDQSYINMADMNEELAANLTVLPLVINHQQADLATLINRILLDYLNRESGAIKKIKVDKVWGALEATTVKKLRQLLLSNLDINRNDCVLKTYWRQS